MAKIKKKKFKSPVPHVDLKYANMRLLCKTASVTLLTNNFEEERGKGLLHDTGLSVFAFLDQ